MPQPFRLYYSPGSCSLVAHIALKEAGVEFETSRVVIAEGEHLQPEFLAINPHARLPALSTEHGVITENIAILNLLADLTGAPGSVPRGDPYATARVNELLGWFSATVHISFATVFRGSRFTADESVWPILGAGGRAALSLQFDEIDGLAVDEWLAPGGFSAADSYALAMLRWAKRLGFEIARYPRWAALVDRVLGRPAVISAIKNEGLAIEEFRP